MSSLFKDFLTPVSLEILRLFPDSLVVGSGILALLTLSIPMFAFFSAQVASGFLFRVFQALSAAVNLIDSVPIGSEEERQRTLRKCRTGFTNADFTSLTIFGGTTSRYPFPSYPLFMVSSATAYLIGTLSELSPELKVLGQSSSSRFYISGIFLSSFLLLFTAFRTLFLCDSFGVALFSIGLGMFIGYLMMKLMKSTFGRESINLLGIPTLKEKTADGRPLYVCPGAATPA
jgi:hypothetical protein